MLHADWIVAPSPTRLAMRTGCLLCHQVAALLLRPDGTPLCRSCFADLRAWHAVLAPAAARRGHAAEERGARYGAT